MPLTHSSDIMLTDADGHPMRFASLAANPLVVVLVRYFGCPSCQAFVSDVSTAVSTRRFAESTTVVAIGGSTDEQARALRYDEGVLMPLLLDPEQEVRALAGVGDIGRGLLNPRGAVRYGSALWRGLKQQKPTRDMMRAPGIAIFGPDLSIRWVHQGSFMGDYPSVDELVDRAGVEALSSHVER